MGGAKMSKSLGNVVSHSGYASVFGIDALRYFVMREMSIGQDATFSDEAVLNRFNADLANDLGNLVSRATTMVHRYCGGTVPQATVRGTLDEALVAHARATIGKVVDGFAKFQITVALQDVWELIGAVNKYIVEREPWGLAKKPDQRALLETTLYTAADTLRVIASLIDPVMPASAERIRAMLGINQELWTRLAPGTLKPGTRLGPTEPLFPRIEHSLEDLRAMATDQSSDSGPASPVPPAPTAAVPAAPVASAPSAAPAEIGRAHV